MGTLPKNLKCMPPSPFFTIYLISCSVVYESTMYSNLIKVLNSISPYRLIFLLSLAPQQLRDEKEYSLGSYPQFQLNNTCGAVGSRYFMLISAQRCFLARRILICFVSASCNGFCMFIININNKLIYIIDIIVSSIKSIMIIFIRNYCAIFVTLMFPVCFKIKC